MERTVRFRWLGVAGIELVAAGETLLIDPFVSRQPLWRLLFGRAEPDAALVARHIRRAEAVLVTHAHWDHVLDVPEVARRTGAVVYGSRNTSALLRALGVPAGQTRTLTAGERLALGAFEVDVLPAEHPRILGRPVLVGAIAGSGRRPTRLRDYRMDSDFSFLVKAASWRLLVWSSETPEGAPPADVLFVKPFASQKPVYAELLRAVRPRVVVPIHWDDFFRPLSRPLRTSYGPPTWSWPPARRVDLSAFGAATARAAPGTRVFVPKIFSTYEIRARFARDSSDER